jgi:hypothetical protein
MGGKDADEDGGATGDAIPFRANTVECVATASRIGVNPGESSGFTAVGATVIDLVHGLVTSSPMGAATVLIWGLWAAAPGRC